MRAAVSRTLTGVRSDAPLTRKSLRLLYVGDSTLARQCFENRGLPIEIVEAVARPNGAFQPISPEFLTGPLAFDVMLVEHDHPGVDAFAIIKDVADRNLPLSVILVVEWDEKLAVPAFKLGASDCVVKASDAFRALLFKLERGILQSVLNKEQTASKEQLELQLHDAIARTAETEQRFDSAMEGFREREADVSAKLDRARVDREALEAKLAAAEASRQDTERRLRLELSAGAAQIAERQAEYEAKLAEAAAAKATLEQKFAQHLTKRDGEYSEQLAQVNRLRDSLAEQLRNAVAAVERTEREHTSEAAAAAARLSKRETELGATLADAIATRNAIERELAESKAALQAIQQRASTERQSAEQQATKIRSELEARVADEAARRQAVEQKLADAEVARHETERRHTSELTTSAAHLAKRQVQYRSAIERSRGRARGAAAEAGAGGSHSRTMRNADGHPRQRPLRKISCGVKPSSQPAWRK